MSERWWDVTNQRWAGGPDSRDTEIDRLRAELADMASAAEGYMRDADHLVAENSRLADELAETKSDLQNAGTQRNRATLRLIDAEAAIARVRELCDEADVGVDDPVNEFAHAILRALDGGTG